LDEPVTKFRPLVMIQLAALLAGCGNAKDSAGEEPAEEPQYLAEARDRFGEQFSCEPNGTDEFVLCTFTPEMTALNPIPQMAFFVYDMAGEEVVHEQNQVTGRVGWVSDFEIEMTLTPGIVTSDGRGAPKYTIDVRSGERKRLDAPGEVPK